jgi:D-hexose-6-phosphate mutarotase
MIEEIIEFSYHGLKHIRLAERHLLKQEVAEHEIKRASFYFNQVFDKDKELYDRLITIYDTVFNQYIELYHKKPQDCGKKSIQLDRDEEFAWTSNKVIK